MSPRGKHAPWKKSVLIPSWVLQFLSTLIILTALVIVRGFGDTLNISLFSSEGVAIGQLSEASNFVYILWIGLTSLSIILTIAEIVLLAKHALKPIVFVIINVIKTTTWTIYFLHYIVFLFRHSIKPDSGLIFRVTLLLVFLTPLIYGSVIYHRQRTVSKSYTTIDYTKQHAGDTSYPPHFSALIAPIEEVDEEAEPGRARRLSYNHGKDTRFDGYRMTSTSPGGGSSAESFRHASSSPPSYRQSVMPSIYVQHLDGEGDVAAFEMGSRR